MWALSHTAGNFTLARRYGAHAGDVWQLEHLADQYGVDRVREWLAAGVSEPLPAAATHAGRFDVLDVLLGAGVGLQLYLALV